MLHFKQIDGHGICVIPFMTSRTYMSHWSRKG